MPPFESNELQSQMQLRDVSEKDLRDLRDVSQEKSLIHLTGDISKICKSALFEMSLRRCMRRLRDASMPAGKKVFNF